MKFQTAPNEVSSGSETLLGTFCSNQIYAVTAQSLSCGRSDEEIVAAALAGGVRVVQVRDKAIKTPEHPDYLAKIRRLKKLTTAYAAILIINDHLDLALAEADGVHLGQTDTPLAVAFEKRRVANREDDFIIGLSTHNLAEAKQATLTCEKMLGSPARELSHALFYINIGPIYATQTKQHLGYPPLGPLGFKAIRNQIASLPITVMGGIKAHQLEELLQAGASHFAMITELTTAPDVEFKVRELMKTIKSFTSFKTCVGV